MEGKRVVRHREIYEHLRSAIARGEYPVGHRIPTETELQRSFNTSRITVTRALRDLEQEGLLVRRRGAVSFVREQKRVKNQLLAWLIGGDPSGIFSPIYSEMSRIAGASGFQLVMNSFLKEEGMALIDQAHELCSQYLSRKVAGMIFAPFELPADLMWINQRIADVFSRSGLPIVLLDRDIYDYPRRSSYDLVGLANRRAGYQVTQHLLGLGYRRIDFVALPQTVSTVTARVAGYQDALVEHGITPQAEWIHHAEVEPLEGVRNLLHKSRAEAFVCVNDHAAAHLVQKGMMLGRRVPQDMAVVGFDDVDYANLVAVPLTTMRQPCARIADAAVNLLLERLAAPDLPTRDVSFDCELIVRESCGARLRSNRFASAG